jgi:hypothetical protein
LFAAMLVAAATSAQASVEISTDPTQNMNCSGGVCSPTAKKAFLNVTDLAGMLSSGDVKVTSASIAMDIDIKATLTRQKIAHAKPVKSKDRASCHTP